MKNLALLIVLFTMSHLASAASATIIWTGKVPTMGCSDKQISNQTTLITIKTQCHSDVVIIKDNIKKNKAQVTFNL
ncbi:MULTISPECIES: hypothetical protein [Aliivibrio]|uniref:Type 1 fimbrial protein n=1 Tax=Aliivibrio finisterrensis TaxID=511998 RepID=A0A4Q5KY19_9GAMM|nr:MULTISPECIES: hypothetical protein [Aliivibrio]MDD9177264.1 hypothetical protein [Aliivibrio sp. A6]RYU54752.1 hypothetical protein ERW57_00445 [Aliivibrio finisterrensis]RYU56426.1 hypothetical protein ERW56_00125 [Aliivibrio finisterrensis]RYU61547.1 hypothetical protein ERW50_00125 [Aliivibrio finisterrensis]RYU66864.1 hypothetical protein ERW53_01725 [Aliivibrio finisterrensis]